LQRWLQKPTLKARKKDVFLVDGAGAWVVEKKSQLNKKQVEAKGAPRPKRSPKNNEWSKKATTPPNKKKSTECGESQRKSHAAGG